jgi:GTP cyclohydrolase II
MLMSLKIKSIKLITNNPRKIDDLTNNGITVTGRIPHVMQPNQYNRFYLETKARKSGHIIDFGVAQRLPEQADAPIIEGMNGEQLETIQKIFNTYSQSHYPRASEK